MRDCIVIHYDEIGIKGANKPVFEKKLVDNIRWATGKKIEKMHARLVVEGTLDNDLSEKLCAVAGISQFSPAKETRLDTEEITRSVLEIADGRSFRLKVTGSKQGLSHDKVREDVSRALSGKGHKYLPEDAEQTYFIELQDKAYVYKDKIRGMGGLPVGSVGKVVSLISGGIDSPVASYRMFRRGCSVVFVHFFNNTLTNIQVKTKVTDLVKILSRHQFQTKLYLLPFAKMQREIIANVEPEYRMVVYRRYMFKIGKHILENEKALAFVTGDNLGQVASQTLENLGVIHEAASAPVLSPLIGENKKDIIDDAKQIGTYETSILPYEDCCSFLVAKHPATKTGLKDIMEMEKKIDDKLIDELVNTADIKVFSGSRQ